MQPELRGATSTCCMQTAAPANWQHRVWSETRRTCWTPRIISETVFHRNMKHCNLSSVRAHTHTPNTRAHSYSQTHTLLCGSVYSSKHRNIQAFFAAEPLLLWYYYVWSDVCWLIGHWSADPWQTKRCIFGAVGNYGWKRGAAILQGRKHTGALKTITDAQPVGQRRHDIVAVFQITRKFKLLETTKRGISQGVGAATCLFVFSHQAQKSVQSVCCGQSENPDGM